MSDQKMAGPTQPAPTASPLAPTPLLKQGAQQSGQQPGQQAVAAWEKAMKKSRGKSLGKEDETAEPGGAESSALAALIPMTIFTTGTCTGDSAEEDGKRGAMDGASAVRDAARLQEKEECGFHADSLVDNLAMMSANANMFEVLMPGGTVLGVAVHEHARQVDFLMSTSDRELEKQIKRQKSVIRRGLESRLGKEIGIELL